MAKEIKAIKCPNCGSVSKTEIKTDFYRCDSCQTEYFLDDNDVNINYNHNYNKPQVDQKSIKKIGIIVGAIFIFIIGVNILSSLFSSPTTYPSTNSIYEAPEEAEEDDQTYYSNSDSYPFLQSSSQKPLVRMLEARRYNSKKYKTKNGTYLATYNPLDKKLLAEEKISEENLSFSDFDTREFSDGNIYMINKKTNTFLKFDKETFKTEEVGQRFFEANNELQIGVATMEFVSKTRGDGLILLTNDGKKRIYYPLIQKLYTEDEFYKAYHGFNNLLPNAKNKTIHVFTTKSTDFPEEKIQLIKVIYKDNGPGPKDIPVRLSWSKDYGRGGIFYGNEPYKKALLNAYMTKAQRVLSLKDISPERLFFGARVLLDDPKNLIIQFRVNANTSSLYKFQKVNAETGEVIWTAEHPKGESLKEVIKFDDGYLGFSKKGEIIVIDQEGKVTDNYNLN